MRSFHKSAGYYEGDFRLLNSSVVKSGVEEILAVSRKFLKISTRKATVLDIGSGRGEYSRELAKHFKSVTGIEPFADVYKFSISQNHKKPKNVKLFNSTVEDFKTKSKFDLIVMLTVFEHMPKQEQSFKKILKLLKKDGVIYFTAPNKFWIFEQHHGLPFLSWLPLPLANLYLKTFTGIFSYEDSSYSKGYEQTKLFLSKFKCSYQFLLPSQANSPYFGCGKKEGVYTFVRHLGIRLISIHDFFWNFSKGFIIVIKRK